MLLKINFKNGNKLRFEANYSDPSKLRKILNNQTGIGDNFYYIKGKDGSWLIVDYQSVQSMVLLEND